MRVSVVVLACGALVMSACASDPAGSVATGSSDIGSTTMDAVSRMDAVSSVPDPGGTPSDVPAPAPDVLEEPDVPVTEGEFGWPCEANSDCASGWCVASAEGMVCSQICIENCPAGWACKQVQAGGGADVAYVCAPSFVHLCDPCTTDADCTRDNAPLGSRCLDRGAEGHFCGVACATVGCPAGYQCEEQPGQGQPTSMQCVPEAGATCECSALAVQQGAATTCFSANEAGQCGGFRQCGAAGLGACDAQTPLMETCNDADDDCDGIVDDDCDHDLVPQAEDNCPLVANPEQTDTDGDLAGNACDPDDDGDNVLDADDCAPEDGAVYPGADEVCDQVDNDCDGSVDEGLCDDANPCTENLCGADGSCLNPPNADPCDDGDVCTQTDVCSAGQCVGGDPQSCDDGNACTADSCDPLSGCSSVAANEGACEDGDLCTVGDHCVQGVCVPGAVDSCDDGNQCTLDACDGGCVHEPTNPCDDANPCTDDACQPGQCVNTPNASPCDDGSVCTQSDACAAGACQGSAPLVCSDDNPCTDDLCHSLDGCHFPPNQAGCEDGNACTGPDLCQSGACVGGTAVDCDDGDVCTVHGCHPATGCTYSPAPNPCQDDNPCTTDVCTVGVGCQFLPNSAGCDDNNVCSTGDQCSGGSCQATGTLNCGDGDVCTTDQCNPSFGCFWTDATGPCNDGSACTTGDTCSGGTCFGGAPVTCDDANPCTTDSCHPLFGCQHTSNDGIACTASGSSGQCRAATCQGGQCVVGDAPDGTGCTTDSSDCPQGQCAGGDCFAIEGQTCNYDPSICQADVPGACTSAGECEPSQNPACTCGGTCNGICFCCALPFPFPALELCFEPDESDPAP